MLALIACGIKPANFGTYDLRAKAPREARNEYRKRRINEAKGQGPTPRPHEGSCPMGSNPEAECRCFEGDNAHKDPGIEKWMLVNSQSGHISQNAFYQGHHVLPGRQRLGPLHWPLFRGPSLAGFGMNASGQVGFELPRLAFGVLAVTAKGRVEHRPVLDTVLLEPNERRFELTWRSVVPVPKRARELAAINVFEKERIP
ncbi:DUF2169 domain-containing protein [Myxococcus stipitatus]|uniref:DUF2169 domain-containing protein n=1 Tax=Myxococcus stipitatus TaxID=83455 RepID=UPI0030D459C1